MAVDGDVALRRRRAASRRPSLADGRRRVGRTGRGCRSDAPRSPATAVAAAPRARPARADPALAVRRQHDRQGRRRHPLRRPGLSRQVRERARPSADRMRLAAIGAAAVVLLGFGWRLRLSRPDYAQVLQGGAVAVLYLTLFAAFRFYGVLAALPAFVLMVAVAALAAALAVLQDARSLAVIGALGGFATPLIVSTGSDNHVALFTYYFVLDLGIAAVAWSKTWRPLNLVGFVATFIVATAWGVLKYRPEDFATSQALPDRLLPALRRHPRAAGAPPRRRAAPGAAAHRARDAWVNSSLLFGLPTVTFALEYGLVRDTPFGAALAALVLGRLLRRCSRRWMRKRPELGITFDATLAIATVFLTLVIPFALDERSTAGAWTLEGAGLVWIGFRQQRGLPRAFGYLLLVARRPGDAARPRAPRRADAGLQRLSLQRPDGRGGVARRARSSSIAPAAPARSSDGEEACEPLLIALATLWLVATAAIEIDSVRCRRGSRSPPRWPRPARSPLLYAALGAPPRLAGDRLAGAGACAARLRRRRARRRRCSPIRSPTAAGGPGRSPSPRMRSCCAWPRRAGREPSAHAVHALGAVALALVGALLGRAATARLGRLRRAPGRGSAGWSCRRRCCSCCRGRRRRGVWPVRAAARRRIATAPARCSPPASGSGRWSPTSPPTARRRRCRTCRSSIRSTSASASRWSRPCCGCAARRPRRAVVAGARPPPPASSGSTRSSCAASITTPACRTTFDAWLASLAVQTGITLLWTAIALVTMWLAATRAARAAVGRRRGAARRAVVLKLLLVDLSGSGSVTRIVSFIGVGVLMLVIGYVAPLPAKEVSPCRDLMRCASRAIAVLLAARCSVAAGRCRRAGAVSLQRADRDRQRRRRSCSCALPPAAYGHAEQDDLRDLRIVDARGERVPFALLAAAAGDGAARASRCARRRSIRCRRGRRRRRLAVAGRRRRRRRSHQRAAPRRPADTRGAAPRESGGWLIDSGETRRRRAAAAAACACAGRARPSSRPPTAIETSDDLRQWRARGQRPGDGVAIAEPARWRSRSSACPRRRPLRSPASGPSRGAAPVLTGASVLVAERQRVAVDSARELTFAPSPEPAGARAPDAARARAALRSRRRPAAGRRRPALRRRHARRAGAPAGPRARRRAVARARRRRLLSPRARRRRRQLAGARRCRRRSASCAWFPTSAPRRSTASTRAWSSMRRWRRSSSPTQGEPPFRLLAGSRDAPAGALPVARVVPQLEQRAAALRSRRRSARSRRRGGRARRRAGVAPGAPAALAALGRADRRRRRLGALVWRLARPAPARAADRRAAGAERAARSGAEELADRLQLVDAVADRLDDHQDRRAEDQADGAPEPAEQRARRRRPRTGSSGWRGRSTTASAGCRRRRGSRTSWRR